MSTIFGEVAGLYDDARPDHPGEIADLVLTYAGGHIASAVEIGAGTGKATALFAGRGFPITCIEPDPLMAEFLTARFPEVTVAATTFEEWTPPAGGVGLVYGAMVWHWLAEDTRAPLAVAALSPGGTLAVIGRRTRHQDPDLEEQIMAVFRSFGPDPGTRPPMSGWALAELDARPELTDLTTHQLSHEYPMSRARYLQMVQTFSPFRRRPPEQRGDVLAALTRTVETRDSTIGVSLETTLILARRTGG